MTPDINLYVNGDEKPAGLIIGSTTAVLYLDHIHGDAAALGNVDHQFAAYLRRLATEAGKLADAIDARLANHPKPEPTCYCDADLVAPHPFSECPHRQAESTAGETRDVPMPGGAV